MTTPESVSLQNASPDGGVMNHVNSGLIVTVANSDKNVPFASTCASTPSSTRSAFAPDKPVLDKEKRAKCLKYFEDAVKAFGISNAGMLLKDSCDQGNAMAIADRAEITEWMKESVKGIPLTRGLEIGAGVGRLTPVLQQLCNKLITVDFVADYVAANRKTNYHADTRPEDEFICADATKLVYEAQSFDLVFWNWLLMYLSDDEVKNFVMNAFKWVKVGGHIFCRESCGEPSDKVADRPWAEGGNPSEYRPWEYYTWLLTEFPAICGYKVEVLFMERAVSAFVSQSGTDGQKCWLVKRVQ